MRLPGQVEFGYSAGSLEGAVGLFPESGVGPAFEPYRFLESRYGFVPAVFRAQSLLAGLVEAESQLVRTVFAADGALPRLARERILLAVAAAYRDSYWVALQSGVLRALGATQTELDLIVAGRHAVCLPAVDAAVIDYALKLSCRPDLVGGGDVGALRRHGLRDFEILDGAVATALSRYLCIIAAGTGAAPDHEAIPIPPRAPDFPAAAPALDEETEGPYLHLPAGDSPALAYFADNFGLVPNLMAAQSGRPDLVDAQVALIKSVFATDHLLSRLQKEALFIAVAAANLSTYCVAVHCELVRALGVSREDADQIAVDHHLARLDERDKALLDVALNLRRRPGSFGLADLERLRTYGFNDQHLLEAVAMTGLTTFFNTLSIAMGETPDFPPQRVLRPQEMHRFPSAARPKLESEAPRPEDPDASLVARVQAGDADAFEELVRRYTRRVFRTLVGILGDPEEARDATQEAFLKAYQHIAGFEGRSKFATWLVSIASNAGLQRLRERRPMDSLDDTGDSESIRPPRVQAWQDDPEELYSKAEIRGLVERGVMRLPAPYRLAVMLRDIEQLPNEEAAAALNLTVPGFKARVFRGRSMLREILAPHFIKREMGTAQ